MTDQKSTVEQQIRPNVLQDQLGIKKDAYYAYLKHLGITAEKDSNGKAFLTEAQAKSIRLLREHVVAGGKIDEFDIHEAIQSALAIAGEKALGDVAEQPIEVDPAQNLNMEALYLEASELAGQRLTASQQVVMAMANQMSYEDLHPTTKAKVDQVRAASAPKFNAQKIAADLLNQCRQQMQVA
ncbi:hypothetical protein Lepto7375DRAFT_0993 [Leptolyngbya sp. PCC 7375]|nr:hypothetical protein Lepto7375DRAFT_0993 [Leptolyngbya sp. PCC 7375]